MIRQIPMYLVLAAHLASLALSWLIPGRHEFNAIALLVLAPLQATMLAMWLILGRTRFAPKLLVLFAVLVNWVVFESLRDFDPSAMIFYVSPLVVIVVLGMVVMRVFGWRLQNVQRVGSENSSATSAQRPQFTLWQIGIAVTAISLLFAVNMYFQFTKEVLGDNEVLAIFLLTLISFAMAIWATLGVGVLIARLPLYAAAMSSLILGLIRSMPSFASDVELMLGYLLPDVTIVPLTLLAFRIAGYRVVRKATSGTKDLETVSVVTP